MKITKITKRDRERPTRKNGGRWGSYESKPRLYMDHVGENMLDNLVNRRSRPTEFYKTLLPQIMRELGLPSSTKARWSQKAGCTCGCSPGFIIQTNGAWDAWAKIAEGVPERDVIQLAGTTSGECGFMQTVYNGNVVELHPDEYKVVAVEAPYDFGFPHEILN